VNLRAMLRLEGLGELITFSDHIETRTRDLPACSIVPQPCTLPRAPYRWGFCGKYDGPLGFVFLIATCCLMAQEAESLPATT
jgi:hypothetical protein